MENRGSSRPSSWEEEQKEKKVQKKLSDFTEEKNG
jgi:hypothetical protein